MYILIKDDCGYFQLLGVYSDISIAEKDYYNFLMYTDNTDFCLSIYSVDINKFYNTEGFRNNVLHHIQVGDGVI